MPLRLRRGTNAERSTITPLEGELIYITDTKKLYVGDGTTIGGVEASGSGGGTGGNLSSSLNLNGYNIIGPGNISITGDINLTGDADITGNMSVTGDISNSKITFTGNNLTSSEGYVGAGGKNIGILQLGKNSDLLQIKREWPESTEPTELQYGITNGFFSLLSSKYSSRGTISQPLVVNPGDALSLDRTYGYDGFGYVLSSSIWQGVDPHASITPGYIPGAIALITEGENGQNVIGINARGFLSINKFPAPATEALDVNGNGLFSGSVEASSFIGPVYGHDSTILVDGDNSLLSNGVITFNQSNIDSNETFVSPNSGSTIGIIELGKNSKPIQIRNYWSAPGDAYENIVGFSAGIAGLSSIKYVAGGTLNNLQSLSSGDILSSDIVWGWDGSDYRLASYIHHSVDSNQSIISGNIPGSIQFGTYSSSGDLSLSGFDSLGNLSIKNNSSNLAEGALDVYGDVVVRGKTVIRNSDAGISTDLQFGITDGLFGLQSLRFTSRGTLDNPEVLHLGDTLTAIINNGYDGTDYSFSSGITFNVDQGSTITTGNVPGQIRFIVNGQNGVVTGAFNSIGYLGIIKPDPDEALDVEGNAIISGTVTAAAFKGTFVADDSTILIDGVNGNLTGSTVTSNGFVMFGSYDAVGRAALTAANGMVIYNTTTDRFQGYQNGAWINLDDGTAAP